jgi:DHA1 family multidrug resistance protein-like MFS transporter
MSRQWRRNLWATWVAELFAIMGFSSMFPILPYYIQSLGVEGEAIHTWTGLIYAAPSLVMGIMAPIWGALSDRYGRKLMVVRAMFGGALFIGLMGFAQTPLQLALLRMIQGALTGTVTAATTLVASGTPEDRLGETLGKLQLAIFLGQSMGPIAGGFVADTLGYRAVLWLTGAFLSAGGVLVLTLVRETFTPTEDKTASPPLFQRLRQDIGLAFSSLLGLVLFLRFSLRLGLRMSSPMLPLWVQELLPKGRLLGSASGLLTTISGLSGALAAPTMGRVADRYGGRKVLMVCSILAGIALILQAFTPVYWLLLVWQAFLGFSIGGTLATISAYIGRLAPKDREGTAYGLDAMAVSLSNSVGPLIGGWLARLISIPATFLVGGVVIILASAGVLRLPADNANGERN